MIVALPAYKIQGCLKCAVALQKLRRITFKVNELVYKEDKTGAEIYDLCWEMYHIGANVGIYMSDKEVFFKRKS